MIKTVTVIKWRIELQQDFKEGYNSKIMVAKINIYFHEQGT
jgi:hypothetical protein